MRILLTTNGKKHSEEAIRFAGDLFSIFKPKLTLLFVGRENIGELAGRVSNEILGEHKLKADIKIRDSSDIAAEIIKETESGEYDLLVLGSRGVSSMIPGVSSYVLGDIPREVIKKVKTSTLIVKEPKQLEKVLITINGSEISKATALFWGSIVKTKGDEWKNQKIILLTVIPELYSHFSDELELLTDEQLSALGQISNEYTRHAYKVKNLLHEKYGINSSIRLREGDVALEILKESERDYSLIVLGRDEVKGHTFGVHLAGIVEQAKIPVLVIGREALKKIKGH